MSSRTRNLTSTAAGGVGQDAGGGGGGQRNDRKRQRPAELGEEANGDAARGGGGGDLGSGGVEPRDPLTAWVYDCYNHDDYNDLVSDLRKFLTGIDFHHVSKKLLSIL